MSHLIAFIRNHSYVLLVSFFLLYSLLLIFRYSFVIDGVRYFSLFDDEMISMRYAYNLAHGHGLVWNPGGERIEGFSNPLWTLYMSFLHLLPIPLEKISVVFQITSMLALLGNLYFVKKIVGLLTNSSKFATILALMLTAFYFPLNNWSIIQGTEVGLLTLILTASTYLVIRALNGHLSLILFVLLGIGVLIRLDFTLPAIVHILMLLVFDPKERIRIITRGIPLFLLIILPATFLRWLYYGDFLPNTYYLKMTGFPILHRVVRGIYVTLKAINPVILLIPFFFAILTKNRMAAIILGIFLTHFAYSMYVGGDAWEWFGGTNRFLTIAMPLFFITLAITIHQVRTTIKTKRLLNFRFYTRAELVALGFLFVILNTGSDNMLLYLTMVKPVETRDQNAAQVRFAKALNQITTNNATIGIVQAGVAPYFSPQRQYIDLLGKSEKVIARSTAALCTTCGPLQQYLSYLPGHMKYDYKYVVTTLRPDIFAQIFPSTGIEEVKPHYMRYISKEGYDLYIRKGSKNIHL